jgi:acetyl esterase/lipase
MRPVLEDFVARCEVDKQPVELILWSEMWHAFERYDELEEAPIALDRAARFIRKATGSETT